MTQLATRDPRYTVRTPPHSGTPRPHGKVDGKFLEVSGSRFFVKGVSYGTFAPDPRGTFLPEADVLRADFARMADAGVNTVRLYTPPGTEALDAAAEAGLHVMVGLPWAQHVAFLSDRQMCRQILRDIGAHVRALAWHPAVLLFALGNEIPPGVVRWHGRRKIERFLRELYDEAKAIAPEALFTYVNYPPTEYLDTAVFDVCSFNTYLHDRAPLAAYLARLQHIAGQKPLLISELGADSVRHSEEGQASLVEMQLCAAFSAGACGAVAFSWTDEWWRGGRKVGGWAFGLVNEAREPKLALHAAARVFERVPFREASARWPRVSVVVCGYNAASTIVECLSSLEGLRYPNFEVVFVNDGSTDATAALARRYASVKIVDTPHAGLATARNAGLAAATGEIIAYTDADAFVDPDWLTFLVQPLLAGDMVGSGGPNLAPEGSPWIAQCVARSPGGPTHVLFDDVTAEHVPGCNTAFRRDALEAIGGFDSTFVRAGDDVDVCWRLQARGWKIGFAPSAVVWHHHRNSIRAYYRQQVGYGEAEAWLHRTHPDKFQQGRILWTGHIYSPLPIIRSMWRAQIHTGPLGRSEFPSVYRTVASPWSYLPHSGRWMAAAGAMLGGGAVAHALGVFDATWLFGLAATALLVTAVGCIGHGCRSDIEGLPPIAGWGRRPSRALYRALIAYLHFVQPLARVHGRLRGWYAAPLPKSAVPSGPTRNPRTVRSSLAAWRWLVGRSIHLRLWSEQWIDPHHFCHEMVRSLRSQRLVRSIVVDDGWREDHDLSIESGWTLRVTARILVEDHGASGSLCRVAARARPSSRWSATVGLVLAVLAISGAGVTTAEFALAASAAVASLAVAMGRSWRALRDACTAAAATLAVVARDRRDVEAVPEAAGHSSPEHPKPGRTFRLPAPERSTAPVGRVWGRPGLANDPGVQRLRQW